MKNLQEIIDRYKDHLPSYQKCAIGMLMWGGKHYFKINSNVPINLNSDCNGFILNKKGQAEEYKISFKLLRGSKKNWGSKLTKYYPHQYFPKKKVKGWEVVRITPGHFVGDILPAHEFMETFGYKYPEFFKPIY